MNGALQRELPAVTRGAHVPSPRASYLRRTHAGARHYLYGVPPSSSKPPLPPPVNLASRLYCKSPKYALNSTCIVRLWSKLKFSCSDSRGCGTDEIQILRYLWILLKDSKIIACLGTSKKFCSGGWCRWPRWVWSVTWPQLCRTRQALGRWALANHNNFKYDA